MSETFAEYEDVRTVVPATPDEKLEAALPTVEKMKEKKTFNAREAINGTTYAVEKVSVYTDAALAHELNKLADEAGQARNWAEHLRTADDGIVCSPEADEAEAKAEALEARVAALIPEVAQSRLTFTVRGVVPLQYRLIDKAARKTIKAPARKNYADTAEGEEEYQTAMTERNIDRNRLVNYELLAKSIVQVENAAGDVDESAWTVDDVAGLHGALLETEWDKLNSIKDNLTFAHTIFNKVIEEDADFLSKP